MASFVKGMKRTTQRLTNKMGLGTETVDTQFNAHLVRYKESQELLEKIKLNMSKIVESHRTLNVATMELSKTLIKFVKPGDPEYESYVEYREAIKETDRKWRDMDAIVMSESVIPTAKMTGEFGILQQRIELRNTRRIDMDRYSANIGGKSKKDKSTFDKALAKCEGAKAAYHMLNEELKEDMPNLCNALGRFYDRSFDNFIRQQTLYLKSSIPLIAGVKTSLKRVDPRACVGHRPVITIAAASAVSQTVTKHKQHEYDLDAVKEESRVEKAAAFKPTPTPTPKPTPTPQPAARRVLPQPAARRAVPNVPARKPAQPKKEQATALWDFAGEEDDELPFKKGDVITILSKDEEWWQGELNGKTGSIPCNYVKLN